MSGANGVMEPKGGTPNIATRSVAKGNALYPAMLLRASAGKSILPVSLASKVIFDGSPLVSCNAFMKIFMKKFYVDITHKSQQRDKKTVKQATKVIISEDNLE